MHINAKSCYFVRIIKMQMDRNKSNNIVYLSFIIQKIDSHMLQFGSSIFKVEFRPIFCSFACYVSNTYVVIE